MQARPAEDFSAFATFLGTPLPDDPLAALRRLRKEAAAEVERLLGLLDALDGDPDLEPTTGDVEPGYVDEAEPDADAEPSLGSFERHPGIWNLGGSQLQWAGGRSGDREGDATEDDESTADEEPSLGATNPQPGRQISDGASLWTATQFPIVDEGIDQGGWGNGGAEDREHEHDGKEPDVDAEPNGDELDYNGDEQDNDGPGTESAAVGGLRFFGDGQAMARDLLTGGGGRIVKPAHPVRTLPTFGGKWEIAPAVGNVTPLSGSLVIEGPDGRPYLITKVI